MKKILLLLLLPVVLCAQTKPIGASRGNLDTLGRYRASGAGNIVVRSPLKVDSAVTLAVPLDTAYNNSVSRNVVSAPVTLGVSGKSNFFGLNYNSTNLKITSTALNTIQDIATGSSPTFLQVNGFTLRQGSSLSDTNKQKLKTDSIDATTGYTTLFQNSLKLSTASMDTPNVARKNRSNTFTHRQAIDSLLEINGSGLVGTYSIPAPTNLTANGFDMLPTGYHAGGNHHNVRVYSYKTIDGVKYYSSTYLTLAVDFDDAALTSHYQIIWAWTAATGVDGYRLLKFDDANGYNYDYYSESISLSLTDNGIGAWTSGSTITPNAISEIASQKIGYDANNYTTTRVDATGTFHLNPTSTGSVQYDRFTFSPAGNFTAYNKTTSDTATARVMNGMQKLTGYTNTNTGNYSSVIGLNNYNTANYSTLSGNNNKNTSNYSSIAGNSDSILSTTSFGNVHIMGNAITVGRDNPNAYGVWAWGARMRAENFGLWLIGAYDGGAPYPIVPFEGAIVFVNENVRHWISNPRGLYSTYFSLQTSSPRCRDTVGFGWQTQKRGDASDATGYMSYNLERNLTTVLTGTKLSWSDYRWYQSFNYNGKDDIHFNLNANDVAKRGWGGVSIDNGKFGVLHGNAFTDTSAYDNVIYGTTNFYGNISGVNIGTMASETATNYVPFTGAGSDVNLGTHTITSGAITSSGNVGIGTTSPRYLTHVGSGGAGIVAGLIGKTFGAVFTGDYPNGIILDAGTTNNGNRMLSVKMDGTLVSIQTYEGSTGAAATDTPLSLQPAAGNVGIGFTAPLSRLTVNGGLHVGGDSDAGDDNLLVDGTITLPNSRTITGGASGFEFNSGITSSGNITATQFKLSALNTAPANAGDTGTLGEIRVVDGFIYVCTATNTWKRCALATW